MINYQKAFKVCAKTIGQPINDNRKQAIALNLIADMDNAQPGEKVYEYSPKDDGQDDEILYIRADGQIDTKEINPVGDTLVDFFGLYSKLYWMNAQKLLEAVDKKALGRKKGSIARSMNKEELRRVINAVQSDASGLIKDVDADESGTSKDLYDAFKEAHSLVEDFGSDYVLLVGSSVDNKLSTYDKDNVEDFNYNIKIKEELENNMNITIKKIYGQIKTNIDPTDPTSDVEIKKVMGTNDAILLARNTGDGAGKPVTFVRRLLNQEMADMMGVDIQDAERALYYQQIPIQTDVGTTLGFGVGGFESCALVVKNPRGIVRINNIDAIL